MAFTGQLTGNVGNDPQLKTTPTGQLVATFSIGLRQRKVKGEWPPSRWIEIEVWGKPAEYVADYVHKGDTVVVFGESLTPKAFQRQDGSLGVGELFRASNVENFGRRSEQVEQAQARQAPAQPVSHTYAHTTQRGGASVDQAAEQLARATGGQVAQIRDDWQPPF